MISAPAVEDGPVLDDLVIEELRANIDGPELRKLVEMFVTTQEPQTQVFAEWLKLGRHRDVADEAHRLVSSAGALGARRVERWAIRIEKACWAEELSSVAEGIEALRSALPEACAALRLRLAPDDA